MSTKLKAILGLTSISLLIYTAYEQNKAINSQKFEINALKRTIQEKDSINAVQFNEYSDLRGKYDSLYADHWSLKTYTDIKEGRAEE